MSSRQKLPGLVSFKKKTYVLPITFMLQGKKNFMLGRFFFYYYYYDLQCLICGFSCGMK